MDFLKITGKTFLITGVANKKSVAFHIAQVLKENGSNTIFAVQTQEHLERVQKLFPDDAIYIVDVENENNIVELGQKLKTEKIILQGLVHSIAFANYSEGMKPFHETKFTDFSQATNISCFSLIALANSLKDVFADDASVVTISISNTKATNYGYMGPIKAALDASVAFLAKSFSTISNVRFNAVCAGPLKTSASAGIPGYVDNYLFAEKLTLRKKALLTAEVANTAAFLLSERSKGINATGILVDAGMSSNYFDERVVAESSRI